MALDYQPKKIVAPGVVILEAPRKLDADGEGKDRKTTSRCHMTDKVYI